ncbi:MAG: hypothetical protein J1F22_01160 [Lachnospiraceae bacterium]|nr:hypothetical protein [Lachnospiraceae bacterium]
MNQMLILLAGIYLAVMAVLDRKYKKIPVIPGVVCLVFVILGQFVAGQSVLHWLPGVFIGAFLYAVSRTSGGSIGEGDAIVYLVTGATLGFYRNLELLMLSLMLAAMMSLVLLVIKKVGRRYALPFIPFTAVAYGMVVLL